VVVEEELVFNRDERGCKQKGVAMKVEILTL
jgi:hypothetical protein